MDSLHNSVETVNAAATAIVSAESRVQPSSVQKRRWGSCWSLYWCFGSSQHRKRIGHAVLVPEPISSRSSATLTENLNNSTSVLLPFIAPPSSPASFLQSDASSAIQSPAGLLSLTALTVNAYSDGGTAPIFTTGPYSNETQLVSPPVFSTYTTEPSTACFTPPPESVQQTTPSSPEVPFAQLLTSSLARNRRNSATNLKLALSQYDFQPYQYPGSPGGHLKSPGSAISNSGTSSPFPDKRPILELRKGEPPKFLGYEHFSTHRWGSRMGSGSLTPNGWGSRLGSGTQTPNGGLSQLGSGSLTPNGGESVPTQDTYHVENKILQVASLANLDNGSQHEEVIIDHRVSFELIPDHVPTCSVDVLVTSHGKLAEPQEAVVPEDVSQEDSTSKETENGCQCSLKKNETTLREASESEERYQKHRSITLGSSKDFNFDNTKEEASDMSSIDCEWWNGDSVAGKELDVQNDWTFPFLQQTGIS